jgi:hypothetical protein
MSGNIHRTKGEWRVTLQADSSRDDDGWLQDLPAPTWSAAASSTPVRQGHCVGLNAEDFV